MSILKFVNVETWIIVRGPIQGLIDSIQFLGVFYMSYNWVFNCTTNTIVLSLYWLNDY